MKRHRIERKPLPDWLPDYAVMTIDEFEDAIKSGFLIDYDGFGEWATKTEVWDGTLVKPSTFSRGDAPHQATHIAWYNR